MAGPPTILSSVVRILQMAVRLVEDSEEGCLLKFVEEIEQCQSRDAYAIFEHIDVLLFVEGKLFVDGVEKGYDVSFVIPHNKVTHRLHTIFTPHCLRASIDIDGYIFVLESTVERFLGGTARSSNFRIPSMYSYGKWPFCNSQSYAFRYLS